MSRDHRSASPDHDEEEDYQLAMRLSAAANGGQLPFRSAAPGQATHLHGDFELAMKMQFGAGNYRSNITAAFAAEPSPWVGEGRNQAKKAIYHTGTPSGKVSATLTAFLAHVKAAQCSGCGELFFSSKSDISTMLSKWREDEGTILSSIVTCVHCSTSSCITCSQGPFAKHSFISAYGRKISWCCSGGRLLLLWLLSCGFDEHFSAVRLKEVDKRSNEVEHNRRVKKKREQPVMGMDGVGFGGPRSVAPGSNEFLDLAYGLGHYPGGHHFALNAANTFSKAKALEAQQTEDRFNTLFLVLIEGLLPMFDRDTSFDIDPPETVAEVLIESQILSYCTELLRNDSLDETTKRGDIYKALIDLIRTCGAHYVTAARTVFNPRPIRGDNLMASSFASGISATQESGTSLFDSLSNLNTQSVLLLQGAKRNEQEFRTEEGQSLLLACRHISDLYRVLQANSGSSPPTPDKSKKAKVSALLELPVDEMMQTYYYATSAKSLTATPPGRFKRLITELTTLKTGLPPGIFVRYAESRPDVQKAMIIGPVGTPYENGLFEFDIFCDEKFPNGPPRVRFKTTGGGRVSFNPNLYPDGKVCLSLLGTWPGEPWVPGQSTLLQVLISLQAMVLSEHPWYNEPGREPLYQHGAIDTDAASQAAPYNQKIRQHTVAVAMVAWLDKPPTLWKDVIDEHFAENANTILENYKKWSKEKNVPQLPQLPPGFGDDAEYKAEYEAYIAGMTPPGVLSTRSSGFASMLPRLQRSLTEKYGATKIIVDDPQEKIQNPRLARSRTTRPQPQTPHTPHQPSTGSPYQPPYVHPMPPPYMPHTVQQMSQMDSMSYTQFDDTFGHHIPPPPLFGYGSGFMGYGQALGSGPNEQAGAGSAPSPPHSGSAPSASRGRSTNRGSIRGRGRGLGSRGGGGNRGGGTRGGGGGTRS